MGSRDGANKGSRRNARPRGALWEARASLSEEAFEASEDQADDCGLSGTRYRGRLVEMHVRLRKGLTLTELALLDAVMQNPAATEADVLQVVLQILQRRLGESTSNHP